MREISCEAISNSALDLAKKAATMLPPDTAMAIECAWDLEESPAGQGAINDLTDNFIQAGITGAPLCPLAGGVLVCIELGEALAARGEEIRSAVLSGVSRGFAQAGLQCNREPEAAVKSAAGDKLGLCLRILPCRKPPEPAVKKFPPGTAPEEIVGFVLEEAAKTLPLVCAPIFVGLGLAGTPEEATLLANEALCRPMERRSKDPGPALLEKTLLAALDKLGIGPLGYGGRKTAFAVNAEGAFSPEGSLFCALQISCHSCRVAKTSL